MKKAYIIITQNKAMRRIIASLLFIALSISAFSQPKEVTLVVTGEGATKEAATNNALRSAVEQTFGVFVSANTEILNDELIRDEVATISSGNIKTFEEVASISSPDGRVMVTLNAVVSIGQLVSYAQNHGASTEFAGSTFGANMRLYELNKHAQQIALSNLYSELLTLSSTMFDYSLEVGEPVVEGNVRDPRPAHEKGVYVPMTVKVVANANTKAIGDYYLNTIKSISCDAKEIQPFSNMGLESYAYYSISFNELFHKVSKNLKFGKFPSSSCDFADPRPQGRLSVLSRPTKAVVNEPMFFYDKIDGSRLNEIFLSAVYGFVIKDNLGNTYRFDYPNRVKDVLGMTTDSRPYRFWSHRWDMVRLNTVSGEFMFDEIAADHPLITGVYFVAGDYGGARLISELLLENCMFMGIVSSNLNFSPGKVIYELSEGVSIDKETVYEISGFEILPISSNITSGE